MKFWLKKLDWQFCLVIFLILVLGIAVLFSISIGIQKPQLFWDQLIFIGIGVVIFLIFALTDYHIWQRASLILYLIGLVLLVLVLFFGTRIAGSSRWFDFKFFLFQPSEIAKIFLILFLANFLAQREKFDLKNLGLALLIVLAPVVLVLLEPDFSSAILILIIGIAMILTAGFPKKYFLILVGIVLAGAPAIWRWVLKPYQKERIISFLNPFADPFGAGYNVLQSIIAVGSGGFWGKGLGQGVQSQLRFLPVPQSDFIFAVTAEELGFWGAGILLGLFLLLFFKIAKTIRVSIDNFGMLIAVGAFVLILFQFFINIGMNLGLAPVTGIPLPLVSYGGSSMISTLFLLGIIMSIKIRSEES